MLGNRFNQAKCETTSRLCVGRIKLIRNKKTVQLKQSQKDIADLLRSGKQEYARIRVEGIIREKYLMQAYEILELYLELLTVRVQLLTKTKELPRDMMEAVSSIIYAAQRISDLPELSTLRTLFAAKYGKEYAAEAAADATASRWQVNANLIRCLLVEAPQPEEKLEMLSEIAQAYGVEWDLSAAARDMGVGAAGPSGQLPHGINSDQGPAATAAAAAATAAAMAAADWPPADRYPAVRSIPVPSASAPAPVLGFNHMQVRPPRCGHAAALTFTKQQLRQLSSVGL
ncbi:hypothetical protein Vretimale_262 [Volvox reticuliferus]|uniref:IST1-like protein n=1 Tax=Volvox reticuliferus TaxID=1737510 RepID=A0A8J4D295_9CHLO|nr:hypothetical protein Vretimale_262 [Volvox reticuliferus]